MSFCFKRILLFTLPLLSSLALFGQKSTDKAFSKVMGEADEYYYYDANNLKAAELYSTLLESNPGHANLQSKLGTCYLSIDGKKDEALVLLKEASKNIVGLERDYSDLGEKAPLDTYLYLGVAYLMNDSIEQAMATFNHAKEKLAGTDLFRDDYFDIQIKNCQYALEMRDKAIPVEKTLFTSWLTKYPGATNPVLSDNDSVFLFTQGLGDINKIYISYRNGEWSEPVDITKEFGNYDKLYTNSISGDGTYLILSMDSQGDGNLYYSQLKNNHWSKIKSLGKEINTGYWESSGFITPNGRTLYFSSNRDGGRGDLDIWMSDINADGSWGTPKNLGPTINSSYNEDAPYFDVNNNALLFSSLGRTGMGDYDVYISYLEQGRWSPPSTLPFAFNTTVADLFYIPLKDTLGYISSVYDEKAGYRNIYMLTEGKPIPEVQLLAEETEIKTADITDTVVYTEPDRITETPEIDNSGSIIPVPEISGTYPELNNILFGFNSSELDEDAVNELVKLVSFLNEHNDIKVELAGFADAVGNTEYNLSLSRARVENTFEYLTEAGIDPGRIIKKAYGETNFVAVNRNNDGTDNPEGRLYNRRVTIGIVDEPSGATIHLEPFTPDHLRLRSAMRYSVILVKSDKPLTDNNFESLQYNSRLFLKTLQSENVNIYSIGIFYSKREANEFLDYVRENGFTDAFIINQYQITDELASLKRVTEIRSLPPGTKRYTIQVLATRGEADTKIFKDITGITSVEGDDGYVRYIYGEYDNFSDTKTDLTMLRESGFPDAFVRETVEL
jgi:outer membrane protein OmpA-like peptidoglycan-associated protein